MGDRGDDGPAHQVARIVVTDDQGRYLVPDLPKAKYKVWVRGYGLVDSPQVDSEPGKMLNLTAVGAPNEAATACVSRHLLVRDAADSRAKPVRRKGNIPEKLTLIDWLKQVKNIGCVGCHQMGQLSTRTFPPGLGRFKSHEEAWMRRIRTVRRADAEPACQELRRRTVQILRRLDGTHRQGRAAPQQADAAAGLERNIVVTWWEWHREALPA